MAINTRVLTKTIGLRTPAAHTLTLRFVFTESAVNAAAGTSTVKCVVTLTNATGTVERFYQYGNARINVKVAGLVKALFGAAIDFDLKPGKTKTLGVLQWNSVKHAAGTTLVSATYSWPTGTSGVATGNMGAAAALALNNAPAPPRAPTWAAANAVTPGAGTSTVLNWVDHDSASNPIAPYASLNIVVEQSDYPDHFTPVSRPADMTNVAGGKLALSNYSVQTFWYTALGVGTAPSLASTPVVVTNVPANHLLVVKPPANPPAQATGWGLAVSRGVGAPANSAAAKVQSFSGTTMAALTKSWTEPVAGPSTTGAPVPTSLLSQNTNFAWSSVQTIPLTGPPWPSAYTVPTIGGFWYRFTLRAVNKTGGPDSVPQIYYCPGSAPSTGGNSTGGGDGDPGLLYSPQGTIPFSGQALNYVNAGCSVTPMAAQILDFAIPDKILTEGAPSTLVNNCGDPRAYWLSASTAGNNVASPYVAEVNVAAYSSRNARVVPQQMLYALQALGVVNVDRAHTITYNRANNNTGSTVSNYIFIGGNPDSANTAASYPIPSGALTAQVSCMAWIQSANVAAGRTVQPFSALKFTALYANGAVISSSTLTPPSIAVNALVQLRGSYTLPANTARVVAAWESNTTSGANWAGGYQANDSISATAFMLLFDSQANQPYFDGGYPNQPNLQIVDGGSLGLTLLSGITDTWDANVSGPSPLPADIASWPPGVIAPLGTYADAYPYAGWTQQWQNTAGGFSGYGGVSQIHAPSVTQYTKPSTDTALVWTDQRAPLGNVNVMAFDALACVVIAGNSALANTNGGLVNLSPGIPFSVSTTAYCPGWVAALGNLARYRLVTTGTGAATTYSPAISENGPLAWTFTVPAGATGAYLALESMTGDPEDVVQFSKPIFHKVMGANAAALGYLGTANAVPLRMAQIQMPAYYRKQGWPTRAAYLLDDVSALSFIPSTRPGTVGQPVLVDPRSVKVASDLRFLASQGYSDVTGVWTPWKSTGAHSLTMHAGEAPYYASADDNNAFSYQLGATLASGRLVGGNPVSIPCLQFDSGIGTWLYSDDFDTAGNISQYTVLLVLNLQNPYLGSNGIWSSVPKAGGGGPDTEADLAGFNYRAVRTTGANLEISSAGMQNKSVQIGQATRLHKPTYLALTFNDSFNAVHYADFPSSVLSSTAGLAGVSGPLLGSIVLGADATDGLSSGAFSLFEMNIYFGAMTVAAIQREIALLGQVYS